MTTSLIYILHQFYFNSENISTFLWMAIGVIRMFATRSGPINSWYYSHGNIKFVTAQRLTANKIVRPLPRKKFKVGFPIINSCTLYTHIFTYIDI